MSRTSAATGTLNRQSSDTFMGEVFDSQSAIVRNVLLTASTDFTLENDLEIGAAFWVEIPSTTTLEIEAYYGPATPDITNTTFHDTFLGDVFDNSGPTARNITLDINKSFLVLDSIEINTNFYIEIPNTSSMEITGYTSSPNLRNDQFFNPYKFSVYRTAALTTAGSAWAELPFDTTTYDTGNNVDVTTNKGRFSAPVSGFYHFNACVSFVGTTNSTAAIQLYVNGVGVKVGAQIYSPTTSTTLQANISVDYQMSAGDYAEIYVNQNAGAPGTINPGSANTWFQGHLISRT